MIFKINLKKKVIKNYKIIYNCLSWKVFVVLYYLSEYIEHNSHLTQFLFYNRSTSGRVRSFGRTPVTLLSPRLTSASNRKYYSVIQIIISFTSFVCMLYFWSLVELIPTNPSVLKKYILVFIKFLIQHFDTFDTFYNIFCTHIIFSLFDILRVDMYFN